MNNFRVFKNRKGKLCFILKFDSLKIFKIVITNSNCNKL